MSCEIEAEWDMLKPDALRRLALKSGTAFVEKEEGCRDGANACDESDPRLLAALDDPPSDTDQITVAH